jgi:multimeric flavodoxin WrbA
MNILIMNGSLSGSAIESRVSEIMTMVSEKGHSVKELLLREMNYSPCRGCFNCWVKTPGLCVFKDDGDILCREALNADIVLLASPLIMGYPSALTKNALDRIIPLIHPYLEDVGGEVHHMKRYKKYPALALLLERSEDSDDEDIEIVKEIFERAALNLQSSLKFVQLTDSAAEETVNEIISN